MFWMGRHKAEESEADLVVEVQPASPASREKIAPYLEGARVRVETARERVSPYVGGARGRVDTARERVTPYVEQALDDAATKIASALAAAGPVREEVQRRGLAAAAALKGEVEEPEPPASGGGWGRRFMWLSLLTGLGAAAVAFFKRRQDDDSWITADNSYPTYGGSDSSASSASRGTSEAGGTYGDRVSASDPVNMASDDTISGFPGDTSETAWDDNTGQAGAARAIGTEDAGGASFDEVAADAADGSTDPSFPDDPAERITPRDVADHIPPKRSNQDG